MTTPQKRVNTVQINNCLICLQGVAPFTAMFPNVFFNVITRRTMFRVVVRQIEQFVLPMVQTGASVYCAMSANSDLYRSPKIKKISSKNSSIFLCATRFLLPLAFLIFAVTFRIIIAT